MDIRQLEHLLALDEHRHFGRAAAAVGISQPALTKSVQRLEASLGAALFDRSRKQATPTAIGDLVIGQARPLVAQFAAIRREVDLMRGKEIGRLSVGVGPAMAESFVTVAVARLAEKYPKARVVVRVDHWSQLSEWLRHGQLDMFVADVSRVQHDEQYRVVAMPSQRLSWFCRSGHPLTRQRRVTRRDLLRFPLVTPKMPDWAKDWLAQAIDAGQPGGDREFASVECESYAMLKRMVKSSDCLSAALASTIDDDVRSGTLATLPIKAPTLRTRPGIVHLRGRTLSPLAEAFVEEVTRAANEAP